MLNSLLNFGNKKNIHTFAEEVIYLLGDKFILTLGKITMKRFLALLILSTSSVFAVGCENTVVVWETSLLKGSAKNNIETLSIDDAKLCYDIGAEMTEGLRSDVYVAESNCSASITSQFRTRNGE